MSTKYIVNNVSGQTITGNLTINGNLSVTGVSTSGLATYKALLTQTGPITGTSLVNDFNYSLIIGETYTVNLYQSGDDFSNIADMESGGVLGISYSGTSPADGSFSGLTGTTNGFGSGATFDVSITSGITSTTCTLPGQGYQEGNTITILGTDISGSTPANDITITVTSLTPNSTGSVFVATGQTPSIWDNSSELISNGDLVVDVLENNLGYDIEWYYSPGEFSGVYIGINATTGPLYNSFNRNTTYVNVGARTFYNGPFTYDIYGGVSYGFIGNKDDAFFVGVFDTEILAPVDDALYYQPFELIVKQDTDTTPIQTYGENVSNFPYSNVSVRVFAGIDSIQSFYGDSVTVNNINELVTQLNLDSALNFLGTYSVNEGVEDGIILTMATNLKNQFSPNNTLTFEVFND
jgi:hypothetical protein